MFDCPLENKYQDAWSHFNYFVYVMDGHEIWHTAHRSYKLNKGSCLFVRKGACIFEQFHDTTNCFIFFFMPDEFICEVLQDRSLSMDKAASHVEPIIDINHNELVQSFFLSMLPYFSSDREPNKTLLELKFKELILTLADDQTNNSLQSYFCSLLQQPQALTLQQVMEDNFCFNLKLEEFAKLSTRSLSAFKRDFQSIYKTTPGKWLLEKRLHHGRHLLTNRGRSVSEAAFESGFESASHFSRVFRQRFGAPPVAVKQQISA